MPFRLIIAFALSFAVHGVLLLPDLLKRPAPPPRPALVATLRALPEAPARPDTMLKNTLDEEESPRVDVPPVTPQPKQSATRQKLRKEVALAQRRLSEHLYYPPEAVARGIEGEVRVIIKLSATGAVEDVVIAAGSGHPILDKAAIRAAYAMGRVNGITSRELILPVIFRLQ